MAKKTEQMVAVDKPLLTGFDGGNAMLQSPEDNRQQAQSFALAALPMALRLAVFMLQHSKNEKTQLEAMKFIKTVADGEIKPKDISRAVKSYTDEELAEVLSGEG